MFIANKNKKARKAFQGYYEMARKIFTYRKDVMSESDRKALENLIGRMAVLVKDKSSPLERMAQLEKEADPLLRRVGKYFYPRHFFAENAEMLLFAAILAIGVRSFFFQPFKIPTNSMYPSYNGMTAEVFLEKPPAAPLRLLRLLTLGASHYRVIAPRSGELAFAEERRLVPARKWFVLPTQKVRYTFYVGSEPIYVDVPVQFDIRLVLEPLFANRQLSRATLPNGTRILRTGIQVESGQIAFAFDILTGDQLFVDRVSYHFRRPQVGDPIVFHTKNIPGIDADNRDKYYIKRAVAGPGDTLQIDPPGLLLNGQAITGADAFEANRQRTPPFSGYVFAQPSSNYPIPFASGRSPIHVPAEHYFAMGDNSPNSADSRLWGFVPQREIVGRAIFIYYPFSHRWGLAR